MTPSRFRHRFLGLIALTWILPPVIGFSVLGYIELFTPAQIRGILAAPLELGFLLGSLGLALYHFDRRIRPLVAAVAAPEEAKPQRMAHHLRRFALAYWSAFLGYLLLAPAITIVSAEIHVGYTPSPVDWFRIHLVSLIVSILVGLPIFFAIFDLFGRALGRVALARPVVTMRTRVFLIGALTPLLIDTMLVLYYWTRTGFFTRETFFVWVSLEWLAVAGALLFMRSFSIALQPLSTLLEKGIEASIVPASTDELGIFARKLDQLLAEQHVHQARLAFSNQLLRESRTLEGLGKLLETIIEKTRQVLGCDVCFLSLFDPASQQLLGVIHTGAGYNPEGHYRFSLNDRSLTVEVFKQSRRICVEDLSREPCANPLMIERFGLTASAGVPLMAGDRPIGVLHAAHTHGPHHYTEKELRILDAFAQEAALAHAFYEDQRLRRHAEVAIRQITEAIANAIGTEFFRVLAKAMAEILRADSVAIGVLTEKDTQRIETLAFYLDGELMPPMCYPIQGTPCERVLGQQARCYLANVQQLFPEDQELAEMGFHSYIGIPLFDSRERPLGVLFAMFRDIPVNAEFAIAVMQIFAARAAAEIERLRSEARIKHLAYYDSLTGLPNRELFMDRLEQALAHAQRTGTAMAIIMMDLDHFKAINDSLGHPIGDQLLQQVAARLNATIRSEDTVARLGGDEFIILLTDIGQPTEAVQHATHVVDKIRQQLAPGYTIEGHSLMVTPSLGIAIYPEDGHNAELLIKHADTALYQAKAAGRDHYRFFSPAMNTAAVERLRLESALRTAIEEQQFELLFQPKLTIAERRPIGAEILLRWTHPELGPIPPDRFIPVAEETGLIIPLGDWVMAQACRYTSELLCQHRECSGVRNLSFNVSPRQFSHPDFVSRLEHHMTTHGTRAGCIELEITENLLIQDIDSIEKKLNRLKALGICIAIDDFGTGYSSLRYLQRLPIDVIKIDREFVRNIATNRNDSAIVDTIVAMAKHLQLGTIAEGVETEEQLQILAAQGCQAFQGYLYSPPLTFTAFQELFAHNSRTPGQ